jgi:hypothetical protein
MRLFLVLVFLAITARLTAGPTPPELTAALKDFRADGPKGWSFVQTTTSEEKSLVERFDPLGKNFLQWTLLKQDGRAPTPDEIEKYNQRKTTRSSNDTAPNVKDQIAEGSCEIVDETAERGIYRFNLNPVDDSDKAARFMNVTFTLHRPTGTIERVELASTGPFSPVFFVSVKEARTVMDYSLPEDGHPSFLRSVQVKIRGRAMWIRSLDQDLSVTYSDYVFAGKK